MTTVRTVRPRDRLTDLVDGLQVRAESTVDTEDTSVDDSGECEIIKDLTAPSPYVGAAVLAHALVVKAIHLGDLPGLVVAPDQGDTVRVSHFEG